MPSIYNAECRTDLVMWCNVCMKARPVWQLGENHYCAWCRWRVDDTAAAPEQLPEYALQRCRVIDASLVDEIEDLRAELDAARTSMAELEATIRTLPVFVDGTSIAAVNERLTVIRAAAPRHPDRPGSCHG